MKNLKLLYLFKVVEMSKIKKGIAVFIVFLILVVIYWFTQLPIYQEPKVYGFFTQFEDGTTGPEVKAILEKYDMMLNYSIDCNQDNRDHEYYIKVYKDNLPDVIGDGLRKDGNWTYDGTYDSASYYFDKEDYCIIPVTKEAITDKKFLEILKKNNLQVKTFFSCFISYRNGSITVKDGTRIKNELETNEKVLTVIPAIPKY